MFLFQELRAKLTTKTIQSQDFVKFDYGKLWPHFPSPTYNPSQIQGFIKILEKKAIIDYRGALYLKKQGYSDAIGAIKNQCGAEAYNYHFKKAFQDAGDVISSLPKGVKNAINTKNEGYVSATMEEVGVFRASIERTISSFFNGKADPSWKSTDWSKYGQVKVDMVSHKCEKKDDVPWREQEELIKLMNKSLDKKYGEGTYSITAKDIVVNRDGSYSLYFTIPELFSVDYLRK
jgi:hypothetical protein